MQVVLHNAFGLIDPDIVHAVVAVLFPRQASCAVPHGQHVYVLPLKLQYVPHILLL